jgi:acetyltransferase-like isoleucine patch superfamily enzyme
MIHETADVHTRAVVGDRCQVWHYAQIREGAHLGVECVLGRGAYIDHDVSIGDRCKIQNYALVYYPAQLASGVFIGPAVQLLNDPYPRAVDPDGRLRRGGDWTPVGVTIEDGASIGAGSIILPGITIGAWSLVGAGSIVTRDVPVHGVYRGRPATETGVTCRCCRPSCGGECWP